MLIHFAEMPYGLSQLMHVGNPTHGQGTAEGPGGRSRHREKSVLQLGCTFLKGLQEVPWCAVVIICFGSGGCGFLGCQDFPGKGLFLQLHHGSGVFPPAGMWESKMGRSHSQYRRYSGMREGRRDGRGVGTTKLCPRRSS